MLIAEAFDRVGQMMHRSRHGRSAIADCIPDSTDSADSIDVWDHGDTCDGFTEPIAKNSPNWRGSTFVDQGRKKNPASSQLCDVGLAGWIAADAPPERRLAKRVDAPSTPVYSEPVVMGVQGAYFGRRALPDHDPTAYRRTQRL
ncbi:predicted protein, partial [Haematococcus lacustris]